MRFWPFGSDKNAGDVEFASRVVTGTARDKGVLRAKVTAAFASPATRERADDLADRAASALRGVFEASADSAALLGTEAKLAGLVIDALPRSEVRSIEIVALHVVGETAAPAPPRAPLSSRPPAPAHPPPPRRMSSGQLLAVRDSRLIPEGATPEVVADAIVPLLRDAGTRTLIGLVRAFDLTVVRHVELDPRSSGEDFGELVPQSTAAPGRFAEDRADELGRWEAKLGDRMAALRREAATISCFFLHKNLTGSGVDAKSAVAILERSAASAFAADAPLAGMARYLQGAQASAQELAARALSLLDADPARADALATAITPTLQSLQDDFAFVAQQIIVGGLRVT